MLTIVDRFNLKELSLLELLDGFVLLIDKDKDWSSFDVVKKVRNTVRNKKVGHAGTLDPFASGLMILGVGKGTKELTSLTTLSKKYQVTIRFGIETDTFDRTGEIIAESSVSALTIADIEEALTTFPETYDQMPPMFSAKRVNGERLYKLARKGVEVERKPSRVTIYERKVLSWESPFLVMTLEVSKGFYIRSFASELGKKTGVGATTEELRRLSISDYSVENSFKIDEFVTTWKDLANRR
jgi:tRNA pseudouridine55 synthase